MSWLYYADRLMEFPTGLLGVALGTMLLPSLSKHYASRSTQEYSGLLDWGLRLTLLLAAAGRRGARRARGAADRDAVPLRRIRRGTTCSMTRRALVAYSLGLLGLILVKMLAPGFYARQNIRTPVQDGLITLVATQAMNLAFIWPLQHAGLALAIGLGACCNAGLLLRGLLRRDIYRPQPGWPVFLFKLAVAVYAMAAVLWMVSGADASWLAMHGAARAGRLVGVVLLGIVAYFASLWLLGFRLADFSRKAIE